MRTKVKTLTPQSRRHIGAARLALSKSDQVLAVANGVAEPFEWHIRVGGLTGLIQLIIEQQVSTASAAAIWKRFSSGVGRITAKRIREFDLESLRGMGLSRQKAQYVLAIAESEESGAIDFRVLPKLSDEEAIAMLTALKGVGRWTAEIYLMFCEGRRDLFPAGDLALQESFRLASGAEARPTQKELYAHSERWRPHRGVAAHLLWSYYRAVKVGGNQTQFRQSRSPRKSK